MTAAPALDSVTLDTPKVAGGSPVSGTVTLTDAAPPDGAQVALSADSGSVTVPASVPAAAGQMPHGAQIDKVGLMTAKVEAGQ